MRAVQEYLQRFGYFPNAELQARFPAWRPLVPREPSWGNYDEPTADAVISLQLHNGLAQSGVVDEATREFLTRPRCGAPDGQMHVDESTKFDLALGKRLTASPITWRINSFPRAGSTAANNLTQAQIRTAIRAAITTWANTADARFSETTATNAHLLFDFIPNCNTAPSPCVTNAFAVTGAFPAGSPHVIGISFDESRAFTAAAAPGTAPDFQTIALHEIGHALGLDHSAMGGVMRADIANFAMRAPAADDAVAARAYYNDWVNLNRQAHDVAAGSNSIWIVSTQPMQYGYRVMKLTGSGFVNESANGGAVKIAVANDGIPWIVDSAGNVHRRSSADHTTGNWIWTGTGCATDIGVGGNMTWILGCTRVAGGYNAYRWAGSSWTQDSLGGSGTRIAVDRFGRPVLANEWREVYRKTSSSPTAGSWTRLTGMIGHDVGVGDVGPDSIVWSVVSSNLFVFNEQPTPVAGGFSRFQGYAARYTTPRNMVHVEVGATGTPLGIDISGNVFRSRF